MKRLFTIFLLLCSVFAYCQKADTSEVYFELNNARVSTIASMALDSLWYSKAIAPGKKTILFGYGDYLGSQEYNIRLSQERAQNVKDYLVALGLHEKDIALCKGKGRIMHKPIPGEIGIYRDRKVQIIVVSTTRKTTKPAVAAIPKTTPVHKKEIPKAVAAIPKKEIPEHTSKQAPPPAPVVVKTPKPMPVASKTATTPPLNKNGEVRRKQEKNLATLDPAKLHIGEVIPLNTILFAPGSNAMLRKSQPGLDELYNFMVANPNIRIEIQGHICCLDPADGSDEPDGLGGTRSEGRAKNIYIYMVSKGLNRNRLRFVGLGNKKPAVFPERTESDRELNRRATIMIIGK